MKLTTVRILGVGAVIVLGGTIGLAAARAVQPPDASQIPIVTTQRPVGSAESSAPTTFAPAQVPVNPVPVNITAKPGSNGPASNGGESQSSALSSPDRSQPSGPSGESGTSSQGRVVVSPPVREKSDDEDHDHETDHDTSDQMKHKD